ncbi:MAG: ATP-binding protein [Actinomycetota bacterium]
MSPTLLNVGQADVVVCHHVLYDVADIVPFVHALTEHALNHVVIEIFDEHPVAWMNPLWRELHGIGRPDAATRSSTESGCLRLFRSILIRPKCLKILGQGIVVSNAGMAKSAPELLGRASGPDFMFCAGWEGTLLRNREHFGVRSGPETSNRMCDLTTFMIKGPSKSRNLIAREFAYDIRSPRAVRRLVQRTLIGWHLRELSDDVSLVATELATNAIVHSESGFFFSLDQQPLGVQIQVEDSSAALPQLRPSSPTSTRGRGLHLVDAIATNWGVERTKQGKIVWARFLQPPR